jgi:hypothetical protein
VRWRDSIPITKKVDRRDVHPNRLRVSSGMVPSGPPGSHTEPSRSCLHLQWNLVLPLSLTEELRLCQNIGRQPGDRQDVHPLLRKRSWRDGTFRYSRTNPHPSGIPNRWLEGGRTKSTPTKKAHTAAEGPSYRVLFASPFRILRIGKRKSVENSRREFVTRRDWHFGETEIASIDPRPSDPELGQDPGLGRS